jgi:hypothetical protein
MVGGRFRVAAYVVGPDCTSWWANNVVSRLCQRPMATMSRRRPQNSVGLIWGSSSIRSFGVACLLHSGLLQPMWPTPGVGLLKWSLRCATIHAHVVWASLRAQEGVLGKSLALAWSSADDDDTLMFRYSLLQALSWNTALLTLSGLKLKSVGVGGGSVYIATCLKAPPWNPCTLW